MLMNRDWKLVPLPPKMQHLKRDDRGFPVPYNIPVDKTTGKPAFKVNDTNIIDLCIRENKCPICGHKLRNDMWCVGGIESAFNPDGGFNDSPMHKECCIYALKVCPYLAYTSYNGGKGIGNITAKDLGAEALADPTQDPAKLPFFVLCRIRSYRVHRPTPAHRFILPEKPYMAIEYWSNGEQITKSQALRLLKEPLTFMVP